MKRCPTCKKTFTDQNLSFCIDDGTPLVTVDTPADDTPDEATLVMPSSGGAESGSAGSSGQSVPAYQPTGSYVPRDDPEQNKRKTWPWVLGLLAFVLVLVAGLGIAGAILVPRMLRASSNTNTTNSNANVQRNNPNPNLNGENSNSGLAGENENRNDNSDAEDTTLPPTDREKVLADLKNLEDEWTVANINADKKKLNRILADDYVGTTEGRAQGKAEYLKTIERDTAIQHWEFEDLKVSLNGDRASLTGIIRLEIKDQQAQDHEVAYRFTDKFVWRDGRWQATGSVVDPLKEGTKVST